MEQISSIIRLLAFSLFTGYVIGVRKYLIDSVSQSDSKLKRFKYLFEITMFISGISIACSSILTEQKLPFYLLIIGGVLIGGVGIFPKYKKNKWNEFMHIFCASGGFIITIIAIGIIWPIWGILVVTITGVVYYFTKSDYNKTLTIELILAYGIFIGLELISILNGG